MRSPQEVARRALALALYYWRATYEERWPAEPPAKREAMMEDLSDMAVALDGAGLGDALSPSEDTLFRRKPGNWHPTDVMEGSWRGENLLALLWALGRRPMPPVWESSGGVHLFVEDQIDEVEPYVRTATLRPEKEIERMERYLEAVRLREITPDGFEGIPWLAGKAHEAGGEPPLDGDLPLDGKPYRLLDAPTKSTVRSLAMERHKALAWVLGDEDDLDAPAPGV